jgi:PLP dependent protein
MTDPASRTEQYRAAHRRVLGRIAAAAARASRDASDVTLVGVSKTVPVEAVRDAVDAGIVVLGENRVQEAAGKIPGVTGARWHLVGPLQSNKARRAVELFDVIESVDSIDLAARLDRMVRDVRPGSRYPILLQVNVDRDPAKAGFAPEDLGHAVARIADLEALELAGLMTIGRLVERPEDARPTFTALRGISERLRADHAALGPALSMGMTDDFEVAVEEGATIVRIGRALFGEREHHHDHGHGPVAGH